MFQARKFSKESYEIYDKMIKDVVCSFIQKMGGVIEKIEEDYDFDIEASFRNKKYYFEVEAKSKYRFTDRDSFPFATVSFTGRKLRLHIKNPFWYVIVNYKDMVAIFCHSNNIYKNEYKEALYIDSQHRSGADEFYRVPKEYCKFIKIQ